MPDDEVKDEELEETEDEDSEKGVDFASLIDEDEDPAEPVEGANPDEVVPANPNLKVDLDGDDDGWEYADEDDDDEEDSYEDSHEE
jgi:hypothetical protein